MVATEVPITVRLLLAFHSGTKAPNV